MIWGKKSCSSGPKQPKVNMYLFDNKGIDLPDWCNTEVIWYKIKPYLEDKRYGHQ